MVGINLAHRDDNFASLDVKLSARKGFVYPELFQRHLAAALGFGLIFAALPLFAVYQILILRVALVALL